MDELFGHMDLGGAESFDVEAISCAVRRKYGLHHASGHHNLTSPERLTPGSELSGKPCDGIEGMPENIPSVSFADWRAILGRLAEHGLQVRPRRGEIGDNNAGIPGIVGDE